jgi:hypothetical protein
MPYDGSLVTGEPMLHSQAEESRRQPRLTGGGNQHPNPQVCELPARAFLAPSYITGSDPLRSRPISLLLTLPLSSIPFTFTDIVLVDQTQRNLTMADSEL